MAIDCNALLLVPIDHIESFTGGLNLDIDVLVKRLLGARGDGEVLSQTRTLLQSYPESDRLRACTYATYMACGVLNDEKDTPLAERVESVIQILRYCQIIISESIARDVTLGPINPDIRFIFGPITCKRNKSDVLCGLLVQSNDRDREMRFDRTEVELIDSFGSRTNTSAFAVGGGEFARSLRYEFKADTGTQIQLRFDNVARSSRMIANLSISLQNRTDRDTVESRYRNIVTR